MKFTVAEPPNEPTNETPTNNSENVLINIVLNWTCVDPDPGDKLSYDVYFGKISPPEKVGEGNQSETSYNPGLLDHLTRYYWRIVAWDKTGNYASGPIWNFETRQNQPPNEPTNPDPENGSTNISIDKVLSWSGGDPDPGETVTYDVYFGSSNPPSKVVDNHTATSYDPPGSLDYVTIYYWKIVAWDNHSASSVGPLWNFSTGMEPNQQPNIPTSPTPLNNSIDVPVNIDLTWSGGDPDVGDTVTYDVYFGTSSSPPLEENNQSELLFTPDPLAYSTPYYWRIVAWDNHGASREGPLWNFTTIAEGNQPPNIPSNPSPANGFLGTSIDVGLSWTGGDPNGDTVLYDVYFGVLNPPLKVIYNQSAISYNPPGSLEYETVYYWKIIAWDDVGESSTGPIWNFTTRSEFNRPPNIPTSESPRNGSTNVKVNSDISWVGGDPDPGDNVTYDVYFGTSSPPQQKVANQSATYYDPGTLSFTTTYYWRIVAWDSSNNSSTSPLFNFKTSAQTGGGGEPPVPPQNIPPTADLSAGEPYQGFVNSFIRFDGANSHDPDGEIMSWSWNFGDSSANLTGISVDHVYSKAGNYTVTLRVMDNRTGTDIATTICVIRALNQPPTRPTISGETDGTKNTPYTYTAVATDPNNDRLQYTFQWGNSIIETRSNIASGSTCSLNHSWTAAGRYELTVIVNDGRAENSSMMTIYIDAIQTRGAGYLLDNDGDGTYDAFYSDETHQTSLVHWNGESYLIDKNGDGTWEYVYNATYGLTSYQEPRMTPGFEVVVFLGAMIGILVLWRKKHKG